jgi:hypothetical protein
MPKKPDLTVIEPSSSRIDPPRKLGASGRGLWDRVQAEFRVDDPGGIELLTLAAQALDRAERLAALINEQGEVIKTRTGVLKAHPALRDELANRSFAARALEKLGVTLEPVRPSVGRPSRPGWQDAD